MKKWTFFNRETGAITGHGTGSLLEHPSAGMIEGHHDHQSFFWCFVTEAVRERPSLDIEASCREIAVSGKETCYITSIPKETLCSIDGGEKFTVTGNIEFQAEHQGEYVFRFEKFPFLPMEIIVRATP